MIKMGDNLMARKKNQEPIDAIKAVWEKYCDIVMEGYAIQIDEVLEKFETSYLPIDGTVEVIKNISDRMKAFRHEFNKKT